MNYSSDTSDELIVGESNLKKLNKSSESDEYYEEEEEIKEKKTEVISIIRNEPIIVKEKTQNRTSQQKNMPSYSSSSDSEDEVYEVEEIVDHRKKNGKLQYFLKWVGYSSSENTWEFEENLECPDLVKDYWKKKGNEKIKKNELKMFQKKEIEIRKKKVIENEKSQKKNQNNMKEKLKKIINQNFSNDPPVFRQIRFPVYVIAKKKYKIKSIIGFKISEKGIIYQVMLNDDNIANLTSNEVQESDPNILLNYFEDRIASAKTE